MNIDKMMKAKAKSVGGLTGGIEHLFKKNKVTYVKGAGKFTGAQEVTVDLLAGGQQKVTLTHSLTRHILYLISHVHLYTYTSSHLTYSLCRPC